MPKSHQGAEDPDQESLNKILKEATIKTAEWFFPLVGLTYACGFLIVFTFFKGYGISTVEFIEAKYIYIGSLFLLTGVIIVIPLRWLFIGIDRWYQEGNNAEWIKEMKTEFFQGRARNIFYKICEKFFLSDWQVSDRHGLHGTFPVTGSATCMMWCFLVLLTFARPDFPYEHPRLIFFNLLFPLLIFGIAIPADWIKNEQKEPPDEDSKIILKKGGRFLKFYLSLLGLFFLVWYFWFRPSFDSHLKYLVSLYFALPTYVIATVWIKLFRWHRKAGNDPNKKEQQRRKVTCWVLFTIQWMLFLGQFWVFLRVITFDSLKISIREVFVGKNWHLLHFPWGLVQGFYRFLVGQQQDPNLFPKGGFVFVLLFILMIFFAVRTFYRVKQVKEYTLRNIISIFCFLGVLFYFSILSFARSIYPYIPAVKGGGDYTVSHSIKLAFETDAVKSIPQTVIQDNQSNKLVLLDTSSSFIFVADIVDAGGPEKWRSTTNKPTVYEIRRDAIVSIAYLSAVSTNNPKNSSGSLKSDGIK